MARASDPPAAALLDAVQELARLTGGVALRHYRSPLVVEVKTDGSPVTVADREAESAARDWVDRRFPGDGVLGEEFGERRPGARRRWIVDPIDGTKSFVRGVPLWGSLVALCEGDTVLAGAAFFPAVDELVAAAAGTGCWWNGRRCAVSGEARLASATVLTTDERFAERPELRAGWTRLSAAAAVSRSWGDCFGYLLVATGRAEVMCDPVLAPWDAAALQPIIREAGGVFTDWSGRDTAFGGSAIASNAALDAPAPCSPLLPHTEMLDLDALDFTRSGGLVTVVAQDAATGVVLMIAHADRDALERTLATGEMHYRSRTRGLWHKGATSGNVQQMVTLSADCDGDAVLARVRPAGPACHTNAISCFGDDALLPDALAALDATIAARASAGRTGGRDVDASYTRRLLADRNLRLKKLGEEAAELVTACADGDLDRAREETADLVYHALVALRAVGGSLADLRAALAARVGRAAP